MPHPLVPAPFGKEDTRAILIAGEIPGYGKVQYAFHYDDLKYPEALGRLKTTEERVKFAQGHTGGFYPTDFRLKEDAEDVVRPAMVLILDNGDIYTETAAGKKQEFDTKAEVQGKFISEAMDGKLVDVIACRPA